MTVNEIIKEILKEIPEITFFAYNNIDRVHKSLPEGYTALLRLPRESDQCNSGNKYTNNITTNETFIIYRALKKGIEDIEGLILEGIQNELLQIFLILKKHFESIHDWNINDIIRWYYYKTVDYCVILEFTAKFKDIITECDDTFRFIEKNN